MKTSLTLLAVLTAWPLCGQGSRDHTKPTQQEASTAPAELPGAEPGKPVVRGLSPEQIKRYLQGEGMGLAKAAELNDHPGPRHLLDLSGPLGLTPVQVRQFQASYEQMRREAMRVGASIVALEAELDRMFAAPQTDPEQVRQLTSRIAILQGDLRYVHLAAHLHTRSQLDPDQIRTYGSLRGHQAH